MGIGDTVRRLFGGPRKDSTVNALALKGITDSGTLIPRKGSPRAVLRLPVESLDGGADVATLQRLAAAINASRGRVTLLAWGKPHTLAGQLQERQERVKRLPDGGRRDLAISGYNHLATRARGTAATADRPAEPPIRRMGFYLVVEERTETALHRLCLDLCALYGAVRCAPAEAAAVESDAWRGMPLPPRGVQLWTDATDVPNVELYVNSQGAHVRRVDPETGRKVEVLYP
jgi:hypothetical protein